MKELEEPVFIAEALAQVDQLPRDGIADFMETLAAEALAGLMTLNLLVQQLEVRNFL
jgi:hypothetical protein